MGSLTASLTILTLAMKVNLIFTDFITLFLLSVRIAITFLIFHLIESGTQGFDLIDPKEMNDSISFVALSALMVSFCGWKINLLISAPLTIILSAVATQKSFSMSDDNMTCYLYPDPYANRMAQRWAIQMMVMLACSYMIRRITLQRFIE